MGDKGLIEHVIVNHRWVFVCLFLLPMSVVYDFVFYLRNWIVFKLSSAPKRHQQRVADVQTQVRKWINDGADTQMCTARPGWATVSFRRGKYKRTMRKISVNLVDILSVDAEKRLVRVEPLVSMGQITATLSKLGWTLPVLPELDDLTVGGLIMGCGIETSSHKYGLFQETCVAYELVLADGSLIRCSEDENPDLFHAVPWSYGTLGLLVAAELQIVPAKKYVKLDYIPTYTRESMVTTFTEAAARPEKNEFVECIVFGNDHGVVMTANMTDTCEPEKVNVLSRHWKPWFYKHVETFLSRGGSSEYIPLRDYYHRHTRSLFWSLQDIISFGNHPVFRWLFGWMVPPKISLIKLTQLEAVKRLYEERQMIQDMLVPINKLNESLDIFEAETQLYPLWLCPMLVKTTPGFIQPKRGKEEMFVDIGAYGAPKAPQYHAETTTRLIEEYVRSVDGYQMLYADTYQTEEEFRRMFNHTLYDKMRKQLDCEKAFPQVYGKVNKKVRE
ncbi:PREDICTED: delta(24)-sterol reductase-like [Priapulus caudatus]|uniref:Delta(24)-sterol reductase n=1 Tax=Priapulus caudatus TaxID=37621 RepID=A0ABM1E934_PRICU|nr:PREDICTED: delta(24)-sterol reductase-like [Priapulus caudatus]